MASNGKDSVPKAVILPTVTTVKDRSNRKQNTDEQHVEMFGSFHSTLAAKFEAIDAEKYLPRPAFLKSYKDFAYRQRKEKKLAALKDLNKTKKLGSHDIYLYDSTMLSEINFEEWVKNNGDHRKGRLSRIEALFASAFMSYRSKTKSSREQSFSEVYDKVYENVKEKAIAREETLYKNWAKLLVGSHRCWKVMSKAITSYLDGKSLQTILSCPVEFAEYRYFPLKDVWEVRN